ncbi:glycosyltransferase family 4 protein [Oscillatoria sp. CS-180]|uniref:glycosyltransferase family 4 protein n=1 Tax=Oscillatoria sp. CS-180 TaxID=3021720 RepID=UPI00232CB301|nr:glycosyltransferase family 4 protein [Oscillatoria sp. CS-180]MDB9525271.1 glycosyltransferase family 4 protein [Oscillatoria sp. CS-180]
MGIYSPYRVLLISTAVAPLGSGLGGGVELFVKNAAQGLRQRGHFVGVLAPQGSKLETCDRLIQLPGQLQPTAHTSQRNSPIVMPEPSVLGAMMDYARQVQHEYDVILHFCYDWLPFYLTPYFKTPIAHYVSMSSLTDAMDDAIVHVAKTFPGTVGVCTRVQAETFSMPGCYRLIGSAVDLSLYDYCEIPNSELVWMGRVSPEKGLEDAIAAVQQAQIPLKILGKLEDEAYWQALQTQYPDAPVEYLGFLDTQGLQSAVRTCRALLMTPKWVEAFGNVAIEALACGVPVIAYKRGGPTEIVHHGTTGWLVAPDSVQGLVAAIARIDELDRSACRQQAEAEFSLDALAMRYENWFSDLLSPVSLR